MIFLREKHREEIYCHTNACLPEEACGLIGGTKSQTEIIIPVENTHHSPVRFRMDENKLAQAFYVLDQLGMNLIGIFHSHPNGPSYPSQKDVLEWQYPHIIHMLCVPKDLPKAMTPLENPTWELIGFKICGQAYYRVPIEII